MIRNYYTEAFKGGTIPTISLTQLIDGTLKAIQTTQSATNLALTASSNLVLTTPNLAIREGMVLSGAGIVAQNGAGYPLTIERVLSETTTSTTNQLVSLTTTVTFTTGGATYTAGAAQATTSNGVGTGMTITTIVVGGAITSGTIVAVGSGYSVGDIVTITGGNGLATFTIASSVTLSLTVANPNVKVGMGISGAGVAPGTTITTVVDSSTYILSQAQSIAANTIITYKGDGNLFTLNQPITLGAAVTITYSYFNRSSWKEYSLYIGSSPAPFSGSGGGVAATAISDAAAAGQAVLAWKQPIALGVLAVGMLVYDDGVLIGTISTIDSNFVVTLVSNIIGGVADLSKLTFVYAAAASVTVTTIDDNLITFANPAEGFVLPVSVVQVNSVANGLSGLIALN